MREVIMVADEPHEYSGHPAKLHQSLAATLIADYSAPGGVVLDPFAGIGTVPRVAAGLGRVGIGVEIEAAYVSRAAEIGVDLIHGDARDARSLVRQPVDLILSSPPYGEAIGRAGDRAPQKTAAAKARYEQKRFGAVVSAHASYGASSLGNIGSIPLTRRNAPCFLSEFPVIVEAVVSVLAPGGRIAWVVKDQRLGRARLGAFDMFGFVRQVSEAAGLIYVGRRVAVLPDRLITQWQRVNDTRWGIAIPNAEHVCVLQRSPATST